MNKTTILIVEDEAIVAADLDGKLRRLGYEVAGIATEGEEAVALALPSPPAPGADGHLGWRDRWTASRRRKRSAAGTTCR